ncbi:hypothetical protein [uncultured Mediterranean phage uvMED]|jgi:hypothetical protein|nr:hypothetical protein [uncultured Mediterranean phage uvMED]BAR17844.1 hypothetical protein [uncultured Mediterranean phage uvMED]
MNNVARFKVPDRMYSANVRMIVDDNPLNAILDYVIDEEGVTPVAVWVKTKKSESTLDRELRSSGKAVSLLLQFGCPLKEISDTFTRDSIIGSVVWYINKNIEDILAGNQAEKTPILSTQPTGYTIK